MLEMKDYKCVSVEVSSLVIIVTTSKNLINSMSFWCFIRDYKIYEITLSCYL